MAIVYQALDAQIDYCPSISRKLPYAADIRERKPGKPICLVNVGWFATKTRAHEAINKALFCHAGTAPETSID